MLRVLLACTVLLAAAPAFAQSPAEARVKKLVEAAGEGSKKIGEIAIGAIEEDANAKFDFAIEPGKTYWVYAACDSNCDDIDLEGADQRGNVLDQDEEKDDIDPVLLVSDKFATRLKVTITMKACGAKACTFGLGLYEQALVWPDGPPKQ